jgi:hypothetical protein
VPVATKANGPVDGIAATADAVSWDATAVTDVVTD